MGNDTEQDRRQGFLRARAILASEGIELNPAVQAELEPYLSGKMTADEMAAHLRAHYQRLDKEATNRQR